MYSTNYLGHALRAASIGKDELVFIHSGVGQDLVTYGDFFANCEKLANALVAAGVQPGDRVAAQIAKTVVGLELYVATVLAGGVFLPLNTAYTVAELEYFIADAQPSVLVCDPSRKQVLQALVDTTETTLWSLAADATGDVVEQRNVQPPGFEAVSREVHDLASILYTSGTTGQPKGAMLTHGNLVSNAATLTQAWHFNAQDCLIHALPIFHIHGLFVAINITLTAGSSLVYLDKYQPQAVTDAMSRATVLMGVPTFYTRLLDYQGFSRHSTETMRLFVSGSAPLLAETHTQFEVRCGHRILERYGMTETGMMSSNPYLGERRAGSVGPSLDDIDIRLADAESGALLALGATGVVEVKGPNVFKGYWNKAEKTAQEFRSDGYFITGDIGRLDEEGYLTIVGRAKDLIISGGLNIYPKELELVLDEMSGVKESAVVGVYHPDFGEAVVAVLVSDGTKPPCDEVIMQQLKPLLARFKQPKAIKWVAELPRNAMSKVQKNRLRETYTDVFR
jgi:malonyl-CoA/methylmalonyl-CoA synthetase